MANNNPPVRQSVQTLLSEIIDYAGLFPPSKLSMAVAVQNYAEYLKSEHSRMLGRFIVPVANLEKFSREAGKFFNETGPWHLSAIAGEDVPNDLKKIARFNKKYEGQAIIEAVELKTASTEEIHRVTKILP